MLSGFRHQQFFLGCTGWGFSFQTILCLFVSIHSNHATFLLRALNWLPVAFSLGWNALFSCLKGWNCYFELIEEASVIFGWWSQYYTKKITSRWIFCWLEVIANDLGVGTMCHVLYISFCLNFHNTTPVKDIYYNQFCFIGKSKSAGRGTKVNAQGHMAVKFQYRSFSLLFLRPYY